MTAPDGWPTFIWLVAPGPAGYALVGGVDAVGAYERADKDELIHDCRRTRHKLTDLNPPDVCLDWARLAADFNRGLWFEVVHIKVWWPAG